MKNFKIRTLTISHSVETQTILYHLGCSWVSGEKLTPINTASYGIRVDNNQLTYYSSLDEFSDNQYPEITFDELKSMDTSFVDQHSKFIKEAHQAACKEWKNKIEKEFPTLFPAKPSFESLFHSFKGSEKTKGFVPNCLKFKNNQITINTPIANTTWSLAIFAWINEFVEHAKQNKIAVRIRHERQDIVLLEY